MIFFRCMPWGGSPTGVSRPIFYEALPGGKGPDSRRLSIFFCADHSNIAVSGTVSDSPPSNMMLSQKSINVDG